MAWAISGAYQNKCQFNLLSSGWICRYVQAELHALPLTKSFGVVKHRDEVTQYAGAPCRQGSYEWLENNPRHSGYIWAIYTLCYLLL